MPSKSDNVPLKSYAPEKDRRRKLNDKQRKDIKEAYASGEYSYNQLARLYGVSNLQYFF